jgi:hypothetical protein
MLCPCPTCGANLAANACCFDRMNNQAVHLFNEMQAGARCHCQRLTLETILPAHGGGHYFTISAPGQVRPKRPWWQRMR